MIPFNFDGFLGNAWVTSHFLVEIHGFLVEKSKPMIAM